MSPGITREEAIGHNKEVLLTRLSYLKLKSVEMIDDGNCQFRAVAYELFGD
jgi:hypothetical protein